MSTRRQVLVFIGAGASASIGYPDSVGVMNDFQDELQKRPSRNRGFLAKLNEIRKILESNEIQFDSESFYSCLEGLASPSQYLKDAGPFAVIMSNTQPINTAKSSELCRRLKRRFERFLLTTYYRRNRDLELRIQQLLDRLLGKAAESPDWSHSKPSWNDTVFHIFTTNYDLLVETYADLEGITINKGYRLDKEGNVIFSPEDFVPETAQINLYKLHGSVQWSQLKSGLIKEDLTEFPGEGTGEQKIVKKVMVYGISKDITAEPFFDLLGLLKLKLGTIGKCFIIGYSFRDPWIRNIFRDVVRKNKDRIRLTYVDRSPKRKIKRYPFLADVTVPTQARIQSYLGIET